LPPLTGRRLVDLSLDAPPSPPWTTAGGEWAARDGGLWVTATAKGASLTGPLGIGDGAVELQVRLGEADRVSLRIHTDDEDRSFRVVLSHGAIDVARNPATSDADNRATDLAKKRCRFNADEWQTLRLGFSGDELTVQVAGETLRCRDPLFARRKERIFCIAFEGEAGLRRLVVAAAD